MKARLLLVILIIAALPSACSAQARGWFSIGPKIDFRFESGWEAGIELSYFPNQHTLYSPLYGITADFSPWAKVRSFHLGFEAIEGFGGIDLGPTLLYSDSKTNLSFTSIVFLGGVLYPFYQLDLTFVNGLGLKQSVGSYLKFPIGGPDIKQ